MDKLKKFIDLSLAVGVKALVVDRFLHEGRFINNESVITNIKKLIDYETSLQGND